MKVVFVDIPVYGHSLPEPHRTVHQLRRQASDLVVERVTGVPLPAQKTAFSRGLLLLASAFRQEEADVLYLHYSDETDDTLAAALKESDIVCMYVMTPTAPLCLRLAGVAKSLNPKAIIACGGPHLAFEYQRFLDTGLVDLVAPGVANPRRVAQVILTRTNRSGCSPVLTEVQAKNSGNTRLTEGEEEYCDYSLLPKPLSQYYFNLSTSNGCAYSCKFCSDGTRSLSLRSVDNLMAELHFLDSHLPAGSWVHFFDTIFTFPLERAQRICELLTNSTRNLVFSCDIKANHITCSLAEKLNQAKFRFVSIGFETAEDSALEVANKGNTFEDCCRTAEVVRSCCPTTALKAYWLFGLPNSSYQSARSDIEQIRLLLRNELVDVVGPKFFVPYPETVYFRRPEIYGLNIWSYDWATYDRFHIPPVSTPAGFTQDQLAQCLLQAERTVLEEYCSRLGISEEGLRRTAHIPRRYNGNLYTRAVP